MIFHSYVNVYQRVLRILIVELLSCLEMASGMAWIAKNFLPAVDSPWGSRWKIHRGSWQPAAKFGDPLRCFGTIRSFLSIETRRSGKPPLGRWEPPEIHMARGRLENCGPPKMSTSCYFHRLCTILYNRECENGYLDFVTQITRKLASASWSCFCLSKVDGRQEPGTANHLTTSHLYCILTW